MNGLETLITEYLSSLSKSFYIRQCLVIIAIFIFGAILTDCFAGQNIPRIKRCVLAYPVGISAFSITAYALLVAGIPYNRISILAMVILECAVVIFLNRDSFKAAACSPVFKHMGIALAAVIVIAHVATSGAAPVSISNDTMYYFRRYPDAIVYYGRLRDQFDFFIDTD